MIRALAIFVALLAAPAALAAEHDAPRIAIIIDDLGYQLALGRRAIALPGPVSYAVLPGTPRGRTLAASANAEGKDVLLHLPMQAVGSDTHAEPVTMTLDMSREHFGRAFETAFAAVPFAIGVNNHRGSLLTRHPGHMRWLMQEILERESLFFIDSYTTKESVALQIAAETGVRAIKRDVFLDNEPATGTIRQQFERLKSLARLRGAAVAIGHPHEATLAFLETALPELAEQGFELVPISELIVNQSRPEHSNFSSMTRRELSH